MRASRFGCIGTGFLVLLLVTGAAAQSASSYEEALDRALAAHAAGDLGEARANMERAHALQPSARTLRGLGIIAFAQERYPDAVAPLEQALASDVRPLTPELRDAVSELLVRVWSRIGRVRLAIEQPGSQVRVDGRTPTSYGSDLLLMPGEHTVEVSAKGHVASTFGVNVSAGSIRQLSISLSRIASMATAAPAEGRTTTLHPGPERPRWWTPRKRNLALVSSAAVVGAGLGFWIAAYRKFQGIDERCRARAEGGCTEEQAQRRFDEEHVRPYLRTGITLTGIGAAAALSATFVELFARRKRADVAITMGPRQVSLQTSF